MVALLTLPSVCLGQIAQPIGNGSYPTLNYYSAFHLLREGEHKLAREAFQDTARTGLRTIDGAWVDAVCYRVMLGEAYLREGQQQLAIDQYNAALNLMFKHREWLKRVTFPNALPASTRRISPPVTWSPRPAKYAQVPSKFQITLGNLDNARVIQQGGVFVPREIHSINVHEIIRCSCIALRRRYELLGPVAQHDPLTNQMLAAFESRFAAPNHWSQAWLNVQRGWALMGAGKMGEAKTAFNASVLLAGRFDHPLTASALMGLGYVSRDTGEPNEALTLLLSASASAAVFENIETVEDALVAATDVHLAGAPDKPLNQLSLAAAWSKRKRMPHLNATAMTLAAENLTAMRRSGAAQKMLTQARGNMGRRAGLSASLAARAEFVHSQVQYQLGKIVAAQTSFQKAIAMQRTVSPWLHQIGTVSRLYRKRSLQGRTASILFEQLLREPQAADWSFRPLETLSYALTPSIPAHEDWFHLSMDRDDSRKALEIGEAMRRRRFYSQLGLGGRVLSLRWCLEAPEEVLSDVAIAAKQDLLARYPAYKELSTKSQELRAKLEALPIDVDEEQGNEQKDVAKALETVSKTQEAMLGEIALRRESCPFVFPPKMTSKELQETLEPKQLALIYVSTSSGLHAFMLSRDDYAHWELPGAAQVRKEAMTMLKLWGLVADNAAVTTERLRDPEWEEAGEKLLRTVIDRGQHGFWKKFEELVIVPDGMMWYIPFEGLPIEEEREQDEPGSAEPEELVAVVNRRGKPDTETVEKSFLPLISQIRIRYVPAGGLINAKRIPPARDARNAVVLGKLFPRDKMEVAQSQLEEIEKVADNVVALPGKLQADSGLLRCSWDGLVVLDDITDFKEGPLDWSPARVDKGRPGGSLRRWLQLPWGGPSQIILPGFHTAAENGLKGKANGEEMFAASMGLMATGARTVIMSRWRTGGLSSYDLVREFLQEEPETAPSTAWQRSLAVIREGEIDPEWEPRVTTGRDREKEPLSGDHPFFWSGYMLLGG